MTNRRNAVDVAVLLGLVLILLSIFACILAPFHRKEEGIKTTPVSTSEPVKNRETPDSHLA